MEKSSSNEANPPELAKEVDAPAPSAAALMKEPEAPPPIAAAIVKEEVEIEIEVEEPVAAAGSLPMEKEGNGVNDEPTFLKPMNELRGLSAALSIFIRRYEELQKHLDFIRNSIDTRSKNLEGQEEVVAPAANVPARSSSNPPIPSVAELPNNETCKGTDNSRSALEFLCDTMGSRGLRKYIASHLSDIAKLREEAPAALKRAPNPAKLVLDCIGRFYLQGKKAYVRDSPMITARQASLLLLKFFLLTGCTQIDPSVKEEAEMGAIAWRKRLINEGGISNADSADAQGLLLFVASYGIPSEFENQDLFDLARLSNLREIADALRQSPFLNERISDIIEGMVKNGMYIVAVDTAFSFGLEDKFPPQKILMSFLRESNEAWKRAKRESQGLPGVMKQTNEKQLAALKSVVKCLDDHKIDPMKLAGWNINGKITKLEKDISDLDTIVEERAISMRRADEIESSKKLKTQGMKHPQPITETQEVKHPRPITESQEGKRPRPISENQEGKRACPSTETQEVKPPRPITETQEVKRPRCSTETHEGKRPQPKTETQEVKPPHHITETQEGKHPRPISETQEVKRPWSRMEVSPQFHPRVMSQEQRTTGISDGKSFYDGGFPGMLKGYSGASSATDAALHGAGGSGFLYDSGIAAGTVAGISARNGAGLPSFAGIGGGLRVGDGVGHLMNGGVGSYVWHGGRTLNDNFMGHNFRASPASMVNDNSVGHNFMGPPASTANDHSVGYNLMGPPASMPKGSFGPTPYTEQDILGRPTNSLDVGSRNSGSDLYHFADTVLEGELSYGSNSRIGNPTMAPAASLAGHPSYFFGTD